MFNRKYLNKDLRKYLIYTSVNSLIVFLITYYIVYFVEQFSMVYIAAQSDIPAILSFKNLQFLIPENSLLWNFDATVSVFAVPYFFSFFLGTVLTAFYYFYNKSSFFINLFVLWLIFHFYNSFFGGFFVGVITKTGIAKALNVMWIGLSAKIIFSFVFLYILTIIGKLFAKAFIINIDFGLCDSAKKRLLFLLFTTLLPLLFGFILVFLMKFPEFYLSDVLYFVSLLFIIIPLLFNYNVKVRKINVKTDGKSVNLLLLITLIALIVFFKLILYNGLKY